MKAALYREAYAIMKLGTQSAATTQYNCLRVSRKVEDFAPLESIVSGAFKNK